jgi:hypothetical protein
MTTHRKKPTDEVWPSMSTLAGNTLASPALTNWAIDTTAVRTVSTLDAIVRLADTDVGAAIRHIKEIRWSRPHGELSASERGTFLHTVFENWLHGVAAPPVPPHLVGQLQSSIDRLYEWFVENKPEMISSEAVIMNERVVAAGRYDAVVLFRAGPLAGQVVLLDLKTKSESTTARGYPVKPYGDSVCLQMAGYRWAQRYADFEPRTQEGNTHKYGGRVYLLSPAEKESLKSTEELWGRSCEDLETAVVLLTPDWCQTFVVDTGPDVLEYLKAVRAAWQWKFIDSADRVAAPS